MSGSNTDLNMSLDEIIAKRRAEGLRNGSRREKTRNRMPFRKPGASYYNGRQNRSRGDNRRGGRFTGRDHYQRRNDRNMEDNWRHDRFDDRDAVPALLQSRPPHCSIDTTSGPVTFEVGTQVFVGGLDPSIDKETLEKLFGIVPGFQSIEMDMDASNRFRGTALAVYQNRESGEQAIAKFDGQSVEYNGSTMTMRLRMLGSRVNQKTAAPSTGFFHSAMDNPEYLCVEEFDVVILDLVTVVCLNTHCH
ncbi:hypothetical protein JH06_1746 [Blastocystis sp. subtype 4]|uniref:hypothetical protein n=1 Tax=Blastocystis sp. subtype 4 TaxID=944170 RepID=UPI000711E9C5|nr:hypothetical protein JH06_1746 [Blastocystis sp. subtype 4]KNB45124.1 hypothetical protein JH06_1746 [Blastocystis sp. subtype 4]|eukprot:XP_014528562.1 hypothetical protein JH06_1746 [Blastocystis sp. subtype 4]